MKIFDEKLQKVMVKSNFVAGINRLLTFASFSFIFCTILNSSCSGKQEEKKTYESDWDQLEKNTKTSFSEFGNFDFTHRVPGGALVLEKRIPTPWFLTSQFKKIEVIPPDSILVNYWKDAKGKPAGMLRKIQFLESVASSDSITPTFTCNEKTRVSFVEKYSDGLHNTIRGYADIYGMEILFEEHFGQMTGITKFIRVGNQLVKIEDVGGQMSEYEIKVNDKKVKSGTDDTYMIFNQDSIIAMLE